MVEVIDNFLSEPEFNAVSTYCRNVPYMFGEVDNDGMIPTGMTHHVDDRSGIFRLLDDRTSKLMSKYPHAYIFRMYVNCFAPSENPYFVFTPLYPNGHSVAVTHDGLQDHGHRTEGS